MLSLNSSKLEKICLQDKVTSEMDRLEAAGIIAKTKFLHWVAPIISIVKRDRTIHICGDYKQTANKFAKTYLLSHTEELFATLSGRQSFTTDLSHVYL